MSKVTVDKRNHLGEVVLSYDGQVMDRGPGWVCLQAPFSRPDVDLGYVVMRYGDLFTEWYYADRWYNIFQIADVDTAQLKGWYCNITRPAQLTDNTVSAEDLQLDVFVSPDGTLILLDEDEFDALNLTAEERMEALRAVEEIRTAVSERVAPFNQIRSPLD
jgi:predicted RNA-binding protein associated with RNAse of E/G family